MAQTIVLLALKLIYEYLTLFKKHLHFIAHKNLSFLLLKSYLILIELRLLGADAQEIIGTNWSDGIICDLDKNPVEKSILNNKQETVLMPTHFESKMCRH
jgi:hypothetical protein